MTWNPVNKPGEVIYDFSANGDYQINLNAAERVHIIEEASGWLRGYVVGHEHDRNGIFPASFVKILTPADTSRRMAPPRPPRPTQTLTPTATSTATAEVAAGYAGIEKAFAANGDTTSNGHTSTAAANGAEPTSSPAAPAPSTSSTGSGKANRGSNGLASQPVTRPRHARARTGLINGSQDRGTPAAAAGVVRKGGLPPRANSLKSKSITGLLGVAAQAHRNSNSQSSSSNSQHSDGGAPPALNRSAASTPATASPSPRHARPNGPPPAQTAPQGRSKTPTPTSSSPGAGLSNSTTPRSQFSGYGGVLSPSASPPLSPRTLAAGGAQTLPRKRSPQSSPRNLAAAREIPTRTSTLNSPSLSYSQLNTKNTQRPPASYTMRGDMRQRASRANSLALRQTLKQQTTDSPEPDVELTLDALKREIASCLVKWTAQIREHTKNAAVDKCHKLKERSSVLLDLRRQLLSNKTPEESKKALRQDIFSLIESSRRHDEGYMVPRNSHGELGLPTNTGMEELHRLHIKMHDTTIAEEKSSLWIQKAQQRHNEQIKSLKDTDQMPEEKFDQGAYQLYIDVKATIFKVGEPTNLHFSVFSRKKNRFLTEEYILGLTEFGMPSDVTAWGEIKTLFVDLTGEDFESDLYMVCKIYRKGMLLYKDRESLKVKRKQDKLDKNKNTYRRPFGCACIPLSNVGLQKTLGEEYTPPNSDIKIYQHETESDFPFLHKLIIKKHNLEVLKDAVGVVIGVRLFKGELPAVVAANPEMKLEDVEQTRKIIVHEIVDPLEVRNDFFVTIDKGKFAQDAMRFYVDNKLKTDNKKQQKNLEVTVRLVDSEGRDVVNVIFTGSGHGRVGVTEYISTVYYHLNNPEFKETFCVSVKDPEVLRDSHLFFTARHVSRKASSANAPFAFAYLKIATPQGNVIEDGPHELQTYHPFPNVHTQHKPEIYLKQNNCQPRKDTLFVSTRLSSTLNAQNINLHQLFHWKENRPQLEMVLRDCVRVPGLELVRYLSATFDVLFDIMSVHSARKDRICFLAYTAILDVFKQLSSSPKWSKHIDTYADFRFADSNAYHLLMAMSHEVFQYAQLDKHHEDLTMMKTLNLVCKCCKYLMKFIMASRLKEVEDEAGLAKDEAFMKSIRMMLEDMNSLLRVPNAKKLLVSKAFILKNFASMFPELQNLYDPSALGELALHFINALPIRNEDQKLYLDKLKLIRNLVAGPVGKFQESRKIIMPSVLKTLKHHLSNIESGQLVEPYLCISILTELLDIVQQSKQEEESEVIWDFTQILPEVALVSLRIQQHHLGEITLVQPPDDIKNFAKLQILADSMLCFWTILHVMSEKQIDNYLAGLNPTELRTFILTVIQVCKCALQIKIFPDMWVVMLMAEHCLIAKVLERFAIPLQRKYSKNQFDYEVWAQYFDLSITVATSPVLKTSSSSKARSDFMKEHYGDIRIKLCDHLGKMWDFLDVDQLKFVSMLVPRLIEVTRCGKEGKNVGMRIYYDMLAQEYKRSGNFRDVESYTIDSLYTNVRVNKPHSDKFVERLVSIVGKKLKDNSELSTEGTIFLGHIQKLYGLMCSLLRYPQTEVFEHERTETALKLMHYLETSSQIRKDMFFAYVQYLVDLHTSLNNYVEAGMTQLQHIQMVEFSDEQVAAVGPFEASTERRRKEELYQSSIQLFDQGGAWERCIEMCNRLQEYYQYEQYDYFKLSKTLQLEASFFEKIAVTPRVYPYFYRVMFYGTFEDDPDVTEHEWVYRGRQLEQLMQFTKTFTQKYSDVKMIMSSEVPSPDTLKQHPRAITVTTLTLAKESDMGAASGASSSSSGGSGAGRDDEKDALFSHNRIPAVVSYEKNNNVCVFSYSKVIQKSKQKKPDNEFKDLWAQRTFIQTEATFPCNRRRSLVVARREVMIHPLQNAIEAITSKTEELKANAFYINVSKGKPDVNQLSMNLTGIIDAAVSGGTKLYVEAFLNPTYLVENPSQAQNVRRLKAALRIQQERLAVALKIFTARAGDSYSGLLTHLRETYEKMCETNAEILRDTEP